MGLPISVIATPSEKARLWFDVKGLPQIRSNSPAEVIVQDDGEDLKDKRNKGAFFASQPYLMFMEEGVYLYEFALKDLLTPLLSDSSVIYTYGDARIVMGKPPAVRRAWDPGVPYYEQELGTVGLVRADALGPYATKRWDAWYDILRAHTIQGAHVPSVLFEKHAA